MGLRALTALLWRELRASYVPFGRTHLPPSLGRASSFFPPFVARATCLHSTIPYGMRASCFDRPSLARASCFLRTFWTNTFTPVSGESFVLLSAFRGEGYVPPFDHPLRDESFVL